MGIGQKIKHYRLQKSWSLQQLADLSGLSKATIQQYEDGSINPSNKSLVVVAKVLGVAVWNFFDQEEAKLELLEFRHGEKLLNSEQEKKRIHDLVIHNSQNYIELEDILNAHITFDNPVSDLTVATFADVEKVVSKIRKKWKLNNNPVDDVSGFLEKKGFKIINVERETESPGLSGFMKGQEMLIPFIIINNHHAHVREVTRKRFTILHEAGHLMMKFSENVTKELEEKLCNRFASAFLLPEESLIEFLGKDRTNISLEELREIKEVFGISIQGIIYRAKAIGLINSTTCDNWILMYEQWLAEEKDFGEYKKSIEEPTRFLRLVARAYVEKRVSKEKVADILKLKLDEVDRRFGTKLSLL
jgi:Zn-dependent peptidase ImmA (M78 family)/DNA-binding XRE family transcriptional regulator